jgi:hypothetical protein
MFGCVVCRLDIPSERARKGATTCSNECAREYGKQKRAELRKRRCGECNRRKAQQRALRGLLEALLTQREAVVSEDRIAEQPAYS